MEATSIKPAGYSQCRHCGHCMAKCPYGLNTPELLQANYKDYWEVLAQSRK